MPKGLLSSLFPNFEVGLAGIYQGLVLCHILGIYIYLIEPPPALKELAFFNFPTS